jgi:hypothetical protein
MARRRTRELVDVSTGEVVRVIVPSRQRDPYIQVFQRLLQTLVHADVLTKTEWRVFALCLAHMTWGNRVPLSGRQMARLLQVQPSHISEALQVLKRCGLVTRSATVRGNNATWEVSPSLAYMGTHASRAWRLHVARRQAQQ